MSILIDVTLGLAITYGLVVLSNRILSVAFTKVRSCNLENEEWELLQRDQKRYHSGLCDRLYRMDQTDPGLACFGTDCKSR